MERPNRLMLPPNSDARSRLRQRMRGAVRPTLCERLPGPKALNENERETTVDEIYDIVKEKWVADDDIDSVSHLAKQLNLLLLYLKFLPKAKLTKEVGDTLIEKLIPLIHHPESQIRAALFRLLRLSILSPAHIAKLLLENVDYAVVRGLDIPESPQEQYEAYNLASHMLWIYRDSNLMGTDGIVFSLFPSSLLKSLASLAMTSLITVVESPEDDKGQKVAKKPVEKFAYPALSILHDVAISHPDYILEIAGTDWLVKCIIGEGSNSAIATFAARILMKWMDFAELRTKGQLRLVLQQLFSPIGDLIFFYQTPTAPEAALSPKTAAMLETFQSVFLSILRSWSGIFACGAIDPKTNEIYADSPFRMLRFVGTAATTVPVMSQIRAIVVKLCCQFIDAPYAGKNFASWDDALEFYSTMHLPDEYKTSLRDDFVVSEMDCLIASGILFPDTVDCLMSYRAIACAIFINAGLAEALIRIVLTDTDDEKGIAATLLLADLLRTGSSFLPRDIRRTLQAVPSLIQAAFERADLDPQNPHDFHMTFPNSNSASLLLRRLDQANDIYFGRESLKSSLHNIHLFLHGGKEPDSDNVTFGNRSRSGSTMDVEVRFDCLIAADGGEYFGRVPLTELCPKKLSSIVECLEAEDGALFSRHKHSEKLHGFCLKIFTLLYPSSNYLVTMDKFSPETMKYIGRLIQVIVPLAKTEPYYGDLLRNFIVECTVQLLPDQLYKGTFSAKNILNTNAHYYFVIIAAIGTSINGVELLDAAGIFQIFQELLTGNLSIEYVKLILSSLNYSTPGSIQRTLLETALTSTDEPSRKWCTRFLGVLAGTNALPNDFGTYGMQLVIGQLGDRSAKVVRHALRVLHQWLPKFPEALPLLHHSVVDPLASAGIFLRAHVFGDEKIVIEHGYETKREITLWLDAICEEYVAVIEEDMRGVLLGVKKCIKGTYARPSNEKNDKYGVTMPIHLFAALAKHAAGRTALMEESVPKKILTVLQNTGVENDKDCAKVKGALLALGHIVGAAGPGTLNELVPGDVIPLIVKFAETCPTLSIRGTAIWALNLVGASIDGARALVKLGWESNRHTQVVDEVVECFCEETQFEDYGTVNRDRSKRARLDDSGNLKPLTKSCSTAALTKLPSIAEENVRPRMFSDSRMALPVFTIKKAVPKKLPLTATKSVPPALSVRSDRAATHETTVTSGFGSAPIEDTAVTSLAKSFDQRKFQQQNLLMSPKPIPNPSSVFATSLLPEFEDIDIDREYLFDRIAGIAESRASTIGGVHIEANERRLYPVDVHALQSIESERTPHYSDAERGKHNLMLVRPIVTLRVPDRTDTDVVYNFLNLSDLICLNNYHKVLYEAGNWQGSTVPCSYERKAGSFAYWNIVSLPVRAEILCQNVFSEEKVATSRTAKPVSVLHKCPTCRRDWLNGRKLTHTTKTPAKIRSDILELVGMIEFRGATLHRELYNHHSLEQIQQAFSDPCLYVDALEILANLRFDAKFRLEIQKLFTTAVQYL